MGIRERKNTLIRLMQARARIAGLTAEQTDAFEMMYRRARDQVEQDQVTKVFDDMLHGWKTGKDVYSRILQAGADIGDFDDDDDPPELRAAIERARVIVSK